MKSDNRMLAADVRQWLLGKYPLPIHMVRAPRLEEWKPVWKLIDGGAAMMIVGIVFDAPGLRDGDEIMTSPVQILDRHFEWARTRSRIYRLGEAHGLEIPLEGIWT